MNVLKVLSQWYSFNGRISIGHAWFRTAVAIIYYNVVTSPMVIESFRTFAGYIKLLPDSLSNIIEKIVLMAMPFLFFLAPIFLFLATSAKVLHDYDIKETIPKYLSSFIFYATIYTFWSRSLETLTQFLFGVVFTYAVFFFLYMLLLSFGGKRIDEKYDNEYGKVPPKFSINNIFYSDEPYLPCSNENTEDIIDIRDKGV